jgi:hypothetical protein
MKVDEVFYSEVIKRAGFSQVVSRAGKSVKNFAKRQAHGITGAYADQAVNIGLNPAAVAQGITSIPGLARGLTSAPKETLRHVGREAFSGGKAGLALGVGLPVALAAPDLSRGDESATGGRTMRQKLVGFGSNVVGGTLTAGVPIVPQIIGGGVIDGVANRVLGGKRKEVR